MENGRTDFAKELAESADLRQLAPALGLALASRGSEYASSLCPFHKDRRPSLAVYKNHYHCFACGAHGNVYELIKHQLSVDFKGSLKWLAKQMVRDLPPVHKLGIKEEASERDAGFLMAYRSFSKMGPAEREMLASFGQRRGYPISFLEKAEVFAANGGKLSRTESSLEERSAFLEAGLLNKEADFDLFGSNMSDFYFDDRVILTIRDLSGGLAGFAGRALSDSSKLKYKFTRGLPKGNLLYRLSDVRDKAKTDAKTRVKHARFDLFIVEGFFDALRLEQLGYAAVAIMGATLSTGQCQLLEEFAKELHQWGYDAIFLHIFLDGDTAGVRGVKSTLTRIWRFIRPGLLRADVLRMDENAGKDPDEIFKDKAYIDVAEQIKMNICSPFTFLISEDLNVSPHDVDAQWQSLGASGQFATLGRIERLMPVGKWAELIDTYDPAHASWPGTDYDTGIAAREVQEFLNATRSRRRAISVNLNLNPIADDGQAFLHALVLARSSVQHRELPTDKGGWLRIDLAGDVFVGYFKRLLQSRSHIEIPMIAANVPKGPGEFRLKAVPCNESLILQQYMLNALLTEYSDTPKFYTWIPAVRSWRRPGGVQVATTGTINSLLQELEETPLQTDTVSFAYQIDMDAVQAVGGIDCRGMYRPYTQCWKHFIAYIDRIITSMSDDVVYIERLDIRKCYDSIPLFSVRNSLQTALNHGLREFESTTSFAPCFSPDTKELQERAAIFVEWLTHESFGGSYSSPTDGSKTQYPQGDRGIPQGPDLSAYLANIALFTIDETVLKFLVKSYKNDPTAIAVGYARYVDDMIIVARSRKELMEIRSIIEEEVAKLGMELNRKSEPLSAMSKVDARSWLTDARGGLGVSGNVDMATTTLDAVLDECGEGEAVDRHEALILAYSESLRDPGTPRQKVLDAIREIRRSPELRFSDLRPASEMIWGIVFSEEVIVNDAVEKYRILWHEANPPILSTLEQNDDDDMVFMIAALDGLENLFLPRAERSHFFKEEEKQCLYQRRLNAAKAVAQGLVHEFLKSRQSNFEKIRFMVAAKEAALLRDALTILGDSAVFSNKLSRPLLDVVGEGKFTLFGLAASLAVLERRPDRIENASFFDRDTPRPLLFLLHSAVARLQIGASDVNIIQDPMESLKKAILGIHLTEGAEDSDVFLSKVLRHWLPDFAGIQDTDETSEAALRSFINVSPRKNIVTWLSRRKTMCADVLGKGFDPLPAPPVANSPSLFAFDNDNGCFCRIDFRTLPDSIDPSNFCGMHWQKHENSNCTWTRWTTESNCGWAPFLWSGQKHQMESQTVALAEKLVRELLLAMKSDGDTFIPVDAYHVLVSKNQDDKPSILGQSFQVLGIPASPREVGPFAFIRSGSEGLIPEPVAPEFYEVWAVGNVVADLLGLVQISRSDVSLNLRSRPFVHELSDVEGWAVEAVLRTGLYRLRGGRLIGRILGRDQTSGLPKTVERVLNNWTRFVRESEPKNFDVCQMLVRECSIESSAMVIHQQESVDSACDGLALLRKLAYQCLSTDEMSIHILDPVDHRSRAFPKRRSPRAWVGVGQRILQRLQSLNLSVVNFPALHAFALGCHLRALHLELSTRVIDHMPQQVDSHIDFSSLDKISWSECNVEETLQPESPREITRDIIEGKCRPDTFANISTLSWWAMLSWLYGTLPGASVAYVQLAQPNTPEDKKVDLTPIAVWLGSKRSTELTFPWEGIPEGLLQDGCTEVMGFLESLEKWDGVTQTHVSAPMHSELFSFKSQARRGRVIVSRPGGTREFRLQQVTHSTLGPKDQVQEQSEDGFYVWTETSIGGKLVGLDYISSQLADRAGFRHASQTTPAKTEIDPQGNAPIPPLTDKLLDHEQKPKLADPDSLKDDHSFIPNNIIDKLRKMQLTRWKKRPKKAGNHIRIAFFQHRVEESYTHPVSELDRFLAPDEDGKLKALLDKIKKHPRFWSVNHASKSAFCTASTRESRRRRLLTECLRSCNAFGVQVLLLPEYSVRPDTVNWLQQNLQELAPSTSVWCGTYRLAPGTSIGEISCSVHNQWAAIMPILFAQSENPPVLSNKRAKRYRSQSAQEVFNPINDHALTAGSSLAGQSGPPFDFITELVCSEIFLIVSPSNFNSLVLERQRLVHKFGVGDGMDKKRIQDVVMGDVLAFAEQTGLTRENLSHRRRSVLLVPAMTEREIDFIIAGQAGYLSSGLTTVFCNAVADRASGGSCFIGTDCSGKRTQNAYYYQGDGPYHGCYPGVYKLDEPLHGPLGKKEQAVVICDVDPEYSFGGRPRPESLGSTLEMVAHLPLIEFDRKDDKKADEDIEKAKAILQKLDSALQRDDFKEKLTSADTEPDRIGDQLKELGKLLGNDWLMQRADSYVRNHVNDPNPWPPPTAIDWLWIGSSKEDAASAEHICVPPFTRAPGEET